VKSLRVFPLKLSFDLEVTFVVLSFKVESRAGYVVRGVIDLSFKAEL
jgi:hypothetical protein